MNQNTPGYQVRLQVLFVLKDGVQRSYMLTEIHGHGCLVELPFDVARGYVEKQQADEIAIAIDERAHGRRVPLVELAKLDGAHGSACCGSCAAGGPCQKAGASAGIFEVDVVGVQKTTTQVAVAGRGRLVSGATVGEPLLAVCEPGVAEDGSVREVHNVACCGGACEGPGTPNALVFDRYTPTSGGYAVADSKEYSLPKNLAGLYAKREHSCLPWVRVEKNPERFRECLAAARAFGPIYDSKAVVKLVGEYLSKQDQECFIVILLDSQLQVRGISEIARGARDRVDVPVPDTLRIAIIDGATAFVVCHQHPSGIAKPSDSDKELTKTIQEAAKTVHLSLMDHVIVAGDKHYSFAKSGKLPTTKGYKG